MNTLETAKYTGIPMALLVKMRNRPTSTLNSGPPCYRTIDKHGTIKHVYLKKDLDRWMRVCNCRITAGEAAMLLAITCDEVYKLPPGTYMLADGGNLIIYPNQRVYIFRNQLLANKLRRKRVVNR